MCIDRSELTEMRELASGLYDAFVEVEHALDVGGSTGLGNDAARLSDLLDTVDVCEDAAPPVTPERPRSPESRLAAVLEPGMTYKTFWRPAFAMWQTEVYNANGTLRLSLYGPSAELSRQYAADVFEREPHA